MIDLPPPFKAKIVGTLRTLLPKLELTNGSLSFQSVFNISKEFDTVLDKANAKVEEKIEIYIGERPLVTMIMNTLIDKLDSIDEEKRKHTKTVCGLSEFADVEKLAERFYEIIASLPLEYYASVELPPDLTKMLLESGVAPIVGNQVAILGTWHGTVNGYPDRAKNTKEPTNTEAWAGIAFPHLSSPYHAALRDIMRTNTELHERSFIYVKVVGYVCPLISGAPMRQFIDFFKAFFSLGIAIGVFSQTYKSVPVKQVSVDFFQGSGSSFISVGQEPIDESTSRLFQRTIFKASTFDEISHGLQTLVRVLDMDQDATQLKLAGRWLFDSAANADSLMGFMQLAICAEVLLGTEDGGEGVIGMLASRCAYLIAKSVRERRLLISDFKNIYRVRSKIVHTGFGIFKQDEFNQMFKLREICHRVIQKEIELAGVDQNERIVALANALRATATSAEVKP